MRSHHQLDPVARGIYELHERAHVPLLALLGRAGMHRHAAVAQLGSGGFQFASGTQLKADGVIRRVPFEVNEGVVAVVAAKVCGARFPARSLETQHFAREAVGLLQITRPQSHVADIEEIDHGCDLSPLSGLAQRAGLAGHGSLRCLKDMRSL